jgi:hypothetical protein
MEHRDQDQIEPSSSCNTTPRSAPLAAEQQQQVEVSQEDRDVARRALAERMQRKHPTCPAPRWFDAGELALVAACSTAIEGDGGAKLQAHREAIVGAFSASKDEPPTVRFIWGKLDHFLDHIERGRRKLRAESAARLRSERDVAHAPGVICTPFPAIRTSR